MGRKFAESQESRELGNVDLRIEYMDRNNVDVQILHNTIFIESCTDRAAVDVAVCKSWNRWLADIWRQGKGRLRWVCMPPTLSMSDALDQIRWSKENGAVAVCLRPVEGSRLLADSYFYPLYETAEKLDMAIAIHIANGSAWLNDLYRHPVPIAATLHRFRIPTVASFNDILLSEIIDVLVGSCFIGSVFGIILGGLRTAIRETKLVPNLGIKLSIRNAVSTGFGTALAVSTTAPTANDPGNALLMALWVGGSVALWYGGQDIIQHYVLRFIVYWKGYTPLHYANFLDYAARLVFLQKVGGGYIFIHRLLLEHFAAMEDERKKLREPRSALRPSSVYKPAF